MSKKLGQAAKGILIILLSGIVGCLLLSLVYMLPVDLMKDNAGKSLKTLEREGPFPSLWGEDMGSRLDNFTDALMIQIAVFDTSKNHLTDALSARRAQGADNPIGDLKLQLSNQNNESVEYSRYWHGYLLFLKPLLLFFTYPQIRILNGIVQVILLLVLLYSMFKKGLQRYILPFLVSILCIAPWILPYSMQNSTMYYIAIIGAIVAVRHQEKVWSFRCCYFLILGIVTSFFDFLTWPVISFGLPYIFLYLARRKRYSIKEALKEIVILGLYWGIGYIFMWGLKWLIGAAVLKDDTIQSALHSVAFRSSGEVEQGKPHYIMVCLRNIKRIMNLAFVSIFGVYCVWNAIRYIVGYKNSIVKDVSNHIPLMLIALVPFAWYLVTRNHAYIHITYTYRNLWISIWAFACILQSICIKAEPEKPVAVSGKKK